MPPVLRVVMTLKGGSLMKQQASRARAVRLTVLAMSILVMLTVFSITCCAAGVGDVAGAVEETWTKAQTQIKAIVDRVVFPVLDLVLAVFFFIKIGTSYFDYRKNGQFEWTAPAILFGCLIFTLTCPLYIWKVLGI